MEPVSEKRKRGRPKGTGKQLTPSQRAINSRKARESEGYKRVEIWLSPLEVAQLEWMKQHGLAFHIGEQTPQQLVTAAIRRFACEFSLLSKRQRKNRRVEGIPPPPGYAEIIRCSLSIPGYKCDDETIEKQRLKNFGV